MKQRDRVTMTADETSAFLAGSRKLQLATLNPDGAPHLVTMFYVMRDGQIAFWTYRSAQKARNLARDPRVTCLVEAGEEYFELRGVQVVGSVRRIEDPARVLEIGRRLAGRHRDPVALLHWLNPIVSVASASVSSHAKPAGAGSAVA